MTADPRLIVPLDLPTVDDARDMVQRLGDAVSFYKIGLELLASDGMALAHELKASGKSIFLDWKLHDIGATVERSARVLAQSGCDLLTVHAEPQVMNAAVKARGDFEPEDPGGDGADQPDRRRSCGDGLCLRSPRPGRAPGAPGGRMRRRRHRLQPPRSRPCPRDRQGGRRPDFLIVTPGVRPFWSAKNDQARAATPEAAIRAGASHLVCGRPITAANDPREAALKVVAEIAGL